MRQRLATTLTLTVGGTSHSIPGGNVRGIELAMTSYGVSGSVEIVVQDDSGHGGKYTDDLLADFITADLGEVSISITPAHWDTSTTTTVSPIVTGGIILDKQVRERIVQHDFATPPVLFRYYKVHFVDPARALWGQHFPVELFTDKTFQDVLDNEKGAKITTSYDWDVLTTERSMIFFHLDPARGATFYDLVIWFVEKHNGVLAFDHETSTYTFRSEKDTSGTASTLSRDEVASLTSHFPAIPRYTPRVLNSYTESTATETVTNDNATDPLKRDVLLRTPVAQNVTDRKTLETARPLLPGRVLEIEFACMPTISVLPGALVDVSSNGNFGDELLSADEDYRVFSLDLRAVALDPGPERDYGDTATGFEIHLSARLEAKSETAQRLPPYKTPHFPGHVEGKVVSEAGEDTDITYQFYTDEDTSVDNYKVKIPLFDDQIVTCPYEPCQFSGTFYLPAYKNERVLVAMHFGHAYIERLLDWRAGAKVAQDGQGEHLLLGKSDTSQTSILHDYEDEKPVLQIKRTNDKDTAILRIEEGKMTLQVKENDG